jgi:hypothetical protein
MLENPEQPTIVMVYMIYGCVLKIIEIVINSGIPVSPNPNHYYLSMAHFLGTTGFGPVLQRPISGPLDFEGKHRWPILLKGDKGASFPLKNSPHMTIL